MGIHIEAWKRRPTPPIVSDGEVDRVMHGLQVYQDDGHYCGHFTMHRSEAERIKKAHEEFAGPTRTYTIKKAVVISEDTYRRLANNVKNTAT